MPTKKALAAVMTVALLTAGTAAPAGAHTKATRSTPGVGTSTWHVCRVSYALYYIAGDVRNICCYLVEAPWNECSHLGYDGWSGAAGSAPASPGRTG